ncbi:MAG: hypothetical protein E7598_07030 [Ruminococcaceae bacterium]|nr:hypothetical protein [Oscillospiraceae bacterium]
MKKLFSLILVALVIVSALAMNAVATETTTTLPKADVKDLGRISVGKTGTGADYTVDSYFVYDIFTEKLSVSDKYFELMAALEFVALDTPEEAANSAYGNYTTDFFITIDGIENGSFVADGCFLAGYYQSYGDWVKIPLDGFTVENGKAYPIITSAKHNFSYTKICDAVQQFKCGIYFPPEVLDQNPDMTVTLDLGLAENYEKAVAADFTTVDSCSYEVEDLIITTLPEADVKDLGQISVGKAGTGADYTVDSYYVYNLFTEKLSAAEESFELSAALEFVAIDTVAEAKKNIYGKYTTDFFITIDGIENGSFVADGCYLAGYYQSYGDWVKIPLDGFTVENGKAYPIITSAKHDFSYIKICDAVQQFKCGIYFTPEVLAQNPDMTVTLDLGLAENYEKAVASDFTTVDSYSYSVEDLLPEKEKELFLFYGNAMTLASSLDMTFYVDSKNLEEGETYTAVMTKKYADGRPDRVVEVSSADWGTKSDLKTILFTGISAKEMTDEISIEIFDSNDVAVSECWVTSVADYALGSYEYAETDELKTVLTDMLNYGAAAQLHFGYNTANLANADLTEEQKSYASQVSAVWEDTTVFDSTYFFGNTLYLKDTIALALYFHNIGNATYATVTYTNHYDRSVTYDVQFSDFGSLKEVKIDTLAIADANTVVTCELKDANGNVVTTVTDSIASSVAYASSDEEVKNDANLLALYDAINKFATSAHAYFH